MKALALSLWQISTNISFIGVEQTCFNKSSQSASDLFKRAECNLLSRSFVSSESSFDSDSSVVDEVVTGDWICDESAGFSFDPIVSKYAKEDMNLNG